MGIEFFIGSASAKAFLMMPIILPLADLVGVTRQVAVLAYCFGVRAWFPRGYEESRARFHQDLGLVQQHWPDARLGCHRLSGDEDLTIDWLQAEALERKERLLVLTTGEHGIEGIVGAAVLQLFVVEFLSRLEPESTGMLLVHAVNPWGMKHRRRTNRANEDLNRNLTAVLVSPGGEDRPGRVLPHAGRHD